MKVPQFIKPGALVGLVSPAGKIAPEYLDLSRKYLDKIGMRHISGTNVINSWHQFAGTDEQRAADLQAMIDNPEVSVIWCMRGGYGAGRLLELVDFGPMKDKPKWLVGFSDITFYHALLQNQIGVASMHAAMPKNLDRGLTSANGIDMLWRFLQGELPSYSINPHPLNRPGWAKGQLTGGNLTILSVVRGSSLDYNPAGKVLFLEEVGEQLYHLDRMMYGLYISGKLEGLAALIVGDMSEMQEGRDSFGAEAYQLIADVVKKYDYPLVFGFPAGHDKVNLPLLLGANVDLNVSVRGVELNYIG